MIRLLLLIVLSLSGVAMASEEPKFSIESKTENYEIRKYDSVIVAETKIDSEFEGAGSQAFQILADYIFGGNKSKTKISKTAPVSQQAASEKIAMTAPVSQVKAGSGFLVQFTMPRTFTLETLPVPNDERVRIRKIPERRLAVFRYTGTWSEQRYNDKLKEFIAVLKQDGVLTAGEPVFARYNPPFMPSFLRRNEIWLEAVGTKQTHE